MKNSIFISYRVSDTGDVTGRIYDYLVLYFEKDHVFKDVQKIQMGLDYRKEINNALSSCRAMLVVIGLNWLTVTDDAGNRRLEQSEDWVRFEIETALSKNIPVIPLLVKGANLPTESELPRSIKELAYRNATKIRLNDPDFGKDMGWLVEGIKKVIGVIETSTVNTSKHQVDLEDLTPDQLKDLRYALIAAFPERSQFKRMVKDELPDSLKSVNLDNDDYHIAVANLVDLAYSQGNIQMLLEGALTVNPGNPKLKKLATLWLKM
ncbi:effector-associated domain EAD1-containing protein [Nostoc sp. ChiQUE01b]|uniref:effector-associated domain EAD1-containing protein n=1 Tax=Nostoc sp. ChiQUE01b TaxID=3075376 RepID=UPI002AD33E93|nr:effector-associated domain EAD1-containing protein [Nostoc sp. ChiQUE01b]MDZ8264377.1 effector-associated domain EAD1-containing protein [Nostoc sp. ChiQUE01b]